MHARIIEYFDHFLGVCEPRVAKNPARYSEKCSPIIDKIYRLKRHYPDNLTDWFSIDWLERLPVETPTILHAVNYIQVYLQQERRLTTEPKLINYSPAKPVEKITTARIVATSKEQIQNQLIKLEVTLKANLGNQKQIVINKVKSTLTPGGEAEGFFTKLFLSPILQSVFPNDVTIEGVNSGGKTQYKQLFFGTKPAPDFVIEKLRIVGEVKYESLRTRQLATAIGQILLYMAASKSELQHYEYGCVIYFDTSSLTNHLSQEETDFQKYLMVNNDIFLILI